MPLREYAPTVPPLEIARGCFWKCRYCQTGGSKPAFRSEDSIALYLEELRRRGLPRAGVHSPFGPGIRLRPPGTPGPRLPGARARTLPPERFRSIEYGIFPSETRPDTVSAGSPAPLRGFVANRRLTFGAQSAATSACTRSAAVTRSRPNHPAVATANAAGFAVNLDFIIALPGETPAERRELLDFMAAMRKKYRVYIQLHHFFPLAGSTLPAASRHSWALMSVGISAP